MSPECTLKDEGTRYVTLKHPMESVMLREDNHKEAIQVVETSSSYRPI